MKDSANNIVKEVFPTRVGVNRMEYSNERQEKRIPHTRGGEPDGDITERFSIAYSPHAWG